MAKTSLMVTFKNALHQDNNYIAIVCANSIFNKMNNYAKKHWDENYKDDYDFSVQQELQEVASLFFADYESANELEKAYGKHTIGSYDLAQHVNYHNIVNTDKFSELIEQWKELLKKLSGKEVQLLEIKAVNPDNPSEELNQSLVLVC